MRTKIFAAVAFISLVLLSATAGGAQTQPQSLTGSAEDFERARFSNPTDIDNKWLPMQPGTRFDYKGTARLDGEGPRRTRRVVSIVTDLTKEIAGVRTLVLWERDYTSGRLNESELAFFAQDDAGNVWRLGEYPEEYENGKFDAAPTWIAGRRGARAGIAMLAEPRLGTPTYAQGFAPAPVAFRDLGRVYRVGQRTCVPVDCYRDVLVIEEFERNVPGAFQLKYYAPGVGNVRVGWRGAREDEKETLALVGYKRLGLAAMAEVRKAAMDLDRRAYKRSAVYRHTPPVEPL